MTLSITMTWIDWVSMFAHFLTLSLLAVGGAIITAPDMHRYLVSEQHWIADSQFSSSIALAQAAPGPNVLFVALLGWNVGLNAGGGMGAGPSAWPLGLLGVCVAMVGIMVPSTTLTLATARWAHKNRDIKAVRAFKQGMAPIVIGLLMATGWILASGQTNGDSDKAFWLLSLVSAVVIWRTKLHLLWMLAIGASAGWLGFV